MNHNSKGFCDKPSAFTEISTLWPWLWTLNQYPFSCLSIALMFEKLWFSLSCKEPNNDTDCKQHVFVIYYASGDKKAIFNLKVNVKITLMSFERTFLVEYNAKYEDSI